MKEKKKFLESRLNYRKKKCNKVKLLYLAYSLKKLIKKKIQNKLLN